MVANTAPRNAMPSACRRSRGLKPLITCSQKILKDLTGLSSWADCMPEVSWAQAWVMEFLLPLRHE